MQSPIESSIEREYTTKQVASILQVDEYTVYRRLKGQSGPKLDGRKEGKGWRVRASTLRAYMGQEAQSA